MEFKSDSRNENSFSNLTIVLQFCCYCINFLHVNAIWGFKSNFEGRIIK